MTTKDLEQQMDTTSKIMEVTKQLREQINLVVGARAAAKEATEKRAAELQRWQEANEQLFTSETQAKIDCQEAETQLREMAPKTYAEVGEKTVVSF